MKNKGIVQKTSNKINFYKLLKKKIRTIIINKSVYNSLRILPSFRNLVNVTLQECKFKWIKEFTTLHHLQEITLSRNYVANTTESAREWLELDPTSSNLELLKTKNNDIPLQITCLKNKTELIISRNISGSLLDYGTSPILNLDLSNNMLGRFEQSAWEWLLKIPIRNNLKDLDISHNYFTAVPVEIGFEKNLHILIFYKNMINLLPREFGTLSQRIILNLSNNLLKTYKHSIWEWLTAPIRDILSVLEIDHNFLTEFPLQIIYMRNLQSLDISANKIDFLPKELGTLPHLSYLNLNSNYLGKSDRNTWEWLEEIAVRNNLLELYLCNNQLTELSPQIGKLSALAILNLMGNKLKRLPHTFGHLKNLKHLDLYENNLLYLPGNIVSLSIYVDVDENPFNLKENSYLFTNMEVPSLMKCTAEVIVKSGINYSNTLPQDLIRYLDEEKFMKKYCFFCKTACLFYHKKCFIKYFECNKILNIELDGTSNIVNANFECYVCSLKCVKKIQN